MSQIRPTSRAALLDAAAQVLARNPGAPLATIAATAGVSRATLHRLFPSRDDLERALALDALEACDEATADLDRRASSAAHALELVIEALVPLGDRFRFLSAAVYDDEQVAAVAARQSSAMTELVDAVKAEGALDPSVPTPWLVAAFDGLVYAAWTAVHAGDLARNEAAALVHRTLLRGTGTPPADAANPTLESTPPQTP